MCGRVLGRQVLVRARADELDAVAEVVLGDQRLDGAAVGALADDPQAERREHARGRADQEREALLRHEPADGEDGQHLGGRRRRRLEAGEVHAVGDELHGRAGALEVAGDVRVAGDHARRVAGALGEGAAADLARVDGVDAEAVRHAEAARGLRGDLGRDVGEVAVHRGDGRAVEPRDDLLGLLGGRAGREHLHLLHELLGAGLAHARLAGLRREDGFQAAGAVERDELVERERLRAAREAAHQHHEPHRESTSSAAATIDSRRCGQRFLWRRNGLGARRRSSAARYQSTCSGRSP